MRNWLSVRDSSARRSVRRPSRGLQLETLETRDVFAAGNLDTSFGTGGIVRLVNDPSGVETVRAGSNLYVGNGNSSVTKLTTSGATVSGYGTAGSASAQTEFMTVQSTGAVITAQIAFGVDLDTKIERVNPAGTKDAAFGPSGGQLLLDAAPYLTLSNVISVTDYPSDLEVDSSDKIWVLLHGDAQTSTPDYFSDHYSAIARLTSAGQLDTTFGTGGFAVVEAPTTDGFLAFDLQLTTDGGAIISGVYTTGGVKTAALYKFDSTGHLVNSFGTSGRALLPQLGEVTDTNKTLVAVDPISGGYYVSSNQDVKDGTFQTRIAKVTSTGAAATFGTNGVVNVDNVETQFTISGDGFGLATQADGKPIIVYGGPNWDVARFTTTGAADTGFGVNGVVETSLGSVVGAYARPQSVLVQADGMILVTGRYSPGGSSPSETVLARYFSIDSNGAPSSSVAAIAATTYQNDLTVAWSGTPAPGSTITGYDIYYKIASGSAVLWQNNTAATSAVFNVQAARHLSVSFYSIARDNLGRVEAAPGTSDATTSYIGAPWQNPVDRYDVLTGGTDTGSIDPGDILYVITEFTSSQISNPTTKEVILPPTKTFSNGRFVDVDGDNLITPSDILFVIVRYNELQGGEGEGSSAPVSSAAVSPAAAVLAATPVVSASTPAVAPPTNNAAAQAVGPGVDDDLLAQLAAAWLSVKDDDE